jgi:outer membrane receptor protein involved in Fe transport
MLRIGVTHVGDSVAVVYNQDAKIEAYTTADLKLGVESEKWSLYTYVTNLTNQVIQLSRDPGLDYLTAGKPQIFYGRPRTIGVDLKYFF